MEKILIEMFVLGLPFMVFIFHKLFSNNRLTAYLIPKILEDKEYPKLELRKAGVAYLALGLWILSIILATLLLYPKFPMEQYIIMVLLCFVFPILSLASIIIGVYYLIIGIFGKRESIRPKFESMFYAEEGNLVRYIKKLKIHTTVNLCCLLVLAALLPIEFLLGIGENGLIVLLNVSLLVAFIMTLWRMRNYMVKSAKLMDLPAKKYLFSTLSVFPFIYWHSFSLIKKFKEGKANQL
ncbi:MAG: hypothetical protein PHW54_04405 [Candidatus Omnitrophica bacterium]|nr:hypothetical protein [Candidatus Omnitrophota bacterium]